MLQIELMDIIFLNVNKHVTDTIFVIRLHFVEYPPRP